jgi:hypothetical protein
MCVYDWVILLVKIHLEDFALNFLFIFNAHFFFFPANIPYPILLCLAVALSPLIIGLYLQFFLHIGMQFSSADVCLTLLMCQQVC